MRLIISLLYQNIFHVYFTHRIKGYRMDTLKCGGIWTSVLRANYSQMNVAHIFEVYEVYQSLMEKFYNLLLHSIYIFVYFEFIIN